ncbi:MAG TPA: hypothetical protein VGM06_19855 [Polyangiaceae bacterium]|jgi:hypothetical protein
MSRHLDKVWLLLVVLAIAVTAACSSSDTSPSTGAPDANTAG